MAYRTFDITTMTDTDATDVGGVAVAVRAAYVAGFETAGGDPEAASGEVCQRLADAGWAALSSGQWLAPDGVTIWWAGGFYTSR